MNLWKEIKALFSRGNNLVKLIYINIAVFFGAIYCCHHQFPDERSRPQ